MPLRTLILAASSLLGVLMTLTEAQATPRPLAFTYPFTTLNAGGLEVEQYIDVMTVDGLNASGGTIEMLGFRLQTEIEVGLSDYWEAAFYLKGSQKAAGDFHFDAIKQRIRGRFADEGEWPIDVGVYLEIEEGVDAVAFEEKVILARRFGDLLLLANIVFEQEKVFGVDELELKYKPSVGFAYELTPGFSLGLEYWLTGDFEGDSPSHFLGPNVNIMSGPHFFTLGVYTRLAGEDGVPNGGNGDLFVRALIGLRI